MNLRRQVLRGQILPTLIALLVVGAVLYGARSSLVASAQASRSQRALVLINSVLADVNEIQASVRGFTIAGRDEYLSSYAAARARLTGGLDELERIYPDGAGAASQRQRQAVLAARRLSERYVQESAERLIALRRRSLAEAAAFFSTGTGKAVVDSIRAELAGAARREEA
ncbi:MAG TPA: CHASE3 domain-containing protein, partial [Deinococcales bacterium]|nr:CHASE3 domain-containing protein [Deinococcales bacterium]